MKNLLLVFVLSLVLASCKSAEKYNEQINKLHPVKHLHNDVDKLYAQLKRYHPKLNQYISKEKLDFKFDSLKTSINQPINSRAFYKKLAPVVAQIKQGHVSVSSVKKRFTRKERKQLNKEKFEFYDLDFEYLEGKLWVKDYRGKDSTLVGHEIVSINNEPALRLIETYKKRFASDGYNNTLHNRLVSKRFAAFYYKDKGFLDSLKITFRSKDSLFSKVFKRIDKDEKKDKNNKLGDTAFAEKIKPKKLTKAQKKANQLAKKKKRKDGRKYGFIPKTKNYTRNFNFIGTDRTVALMKIRSFSNKSYKKFYKESFSILEAAKTKYLILDLRDNLGGRIAEVDHLYSYLTNKNYVFINPIEINSRFPLTTSLLSNGNPALLKIIGVLLVTEPITMISEYLKTIKKDGKLYYKMKYNKSRKPKVMNYKGEIYVLTNGNSFSASSLISTHLKSANRATFVGEETGGAYNGCVAGFYKTYKLQNTRLKIRMGLMQIEAPQKQIPDGFGIKPDVEVLPNVKDRKSNIDTELQWVLNAINKKENSNN